MDDLQALDEQLYKNLILVKYYEGNVQDLGLTMCVDEKLPGGKSEVAELVPNGAQIPVTNDNRMLYIIKYSNYMLNIRTHK